MHIIPLFLSLIFLSAGAGAKEIHCSSLSNTDLETEGYWYLLDTDYQKGDGGFQMNGINWYKSWCNNDAEWPLNKGIGHINVLVEDTGLDDAVIMSENIWSSPTGACIVPNKGIPCKKAPTPSVQSQ